MLQSEKEGPGPGLLEIARSLEPLIRRPPHPQVGG